MCFQWKTVTFQKLHHLYKNYQCFQWKTSIFQKLSPLFQEIVSAFNANGRQHLYANFLVEYFLFVILISDILYIDDSICIVTPPFKYSALRLESLI
jgi:hypothetical protein